MRERKSINNHERCFMKSLQLCFATLLILGFTAQARAEFGVGVIGSYHLSDNYSFSGTGADSVKAKSGSSFGALAFVPILPWFSLRAGVSYEDLAFEYKYTNGTTDDGKLTNMLVPVNLQFSLPLTGLYAFGGVVFSTNQKTSPDTGSKARNDTRTNLGLGYDFFSFTLLTLSGEVEYMMGNSNISPAAGTELKTNFVNLNLMARFTL